MHPEPCFHATSCTLFPCCVCARQAPSSLSLSLSPPPPLTRVRAQNSSEQRSKDSISRTHHQGPASRHAAVPSAHRASAHLARPTAWCAPECMWFAARARAGPRARRLQPMIRILRVWQSWKIPNMNMTTHKSAPRPSACWRPFKLLLLCCLRRTLVRHTTCYVDTRGREREYASGRETQHGGERYRTSQKGASLPSLNLSLPVSLSFAISILCLHRPL